MRTATALLALACALCGASCRSLQRLARVQPLAGDPHPERVNVWPLYYRNGAAVAALWPFYDQDERGFALRPLITHDGQDWELLPPIAWWNTESGDWIVLPAYSLGDTWGVLPLAGFGDLDFIGPVWWTEDASGLFPVAAFGDPLSWIGPAWWKCSEAGDVEQHGLLPLYTWSERFHNVGPVLWGEDADGRRWATAALVWGQVTLGEERDELTWYGPVWWVDDAAGERESWGLFPLATNVEDFHQIGPVIWKDAEGGGKQYVVALPLFGVWYGADGSGQMLSPFGGRGWDAEGDTRWLNVLGPVYHRSGTDAERRTDVLWPIVHWSEGQAGSEWAAWPLVGVERTAATEEAGARRSAWGLLGLVRSSSGSDGVDALRVAPLFSTRSSDAAAWSFWDFLTLYGDFRGDDGSRDLHVGTPLVFDWHRDAQGRSWSALLTALDYEATADESSFDFLWYVYRRRTVGAETRRDCFPFISWDTHSGADGGEPGTRFSFLWRLLHYERRGARRGGHLLFLPWGDLE